MERESFHSVCVKECWDESELSRYMAPIIAISSSSDGEVQLIVVQPIDIIKVVILSPLVDGQL